MLRDDGPSVIVALEDDRHEDGFAARDDRAGTRVDACNLASGQEDAEQEEALLGTPAARSRDRHLRGGEFEPLLDTRSAYRSCRRSVGRSSCENRTPRPSRSRNGFATQPERRRGPGSRKVGGT